MASHHFIGNGQISADLVETAKDGSRLLDRFAERVRDAGLEVVEQSLVAFDNQGLTGVWVLAESHLVLHYWGREGFATIDLHVCDYSSSNASRATRLVEDLTSLCFAPGTETWHELHLEDPVPAGAAAAS